MNKITHKPSLYGILVIALLSGALLLPNQAAAKDTDRDGGRDRDGSRDRQYSSSSYSGSSSGSRSSGSGGGSSSDAYAQYQRQQQARAQQQAAAQRAAQVRKAPVAVAASNVSTPAGPVTDIAPPPAAQPAPAPTRSQPTMIKGVTASSVYQPKGFAPQTTELLYALAIASSATGLAVIATDLRRRYSADQILGRRVTAMR